MTANADNNNITGVNHPGDAPDPEHLGVALWATDEQRAKIQQSAEQLMRALTILDAMDAAEARDQKNFADVLTAFGQTPEGRAVYRLLDRVLESREHGRPIWTSSRLDLLKRALGVLEYDVRRAIGLLLIDSKDGVWQLSEPVSNALSVVVSMLDDGADAAALLQEIGELRTEWTRIFRTRSRSEQARTKLEINHRALRWVANIVNAMSEGTMAGDPPTLDNVRNIVVMLSYVVRILPVTQEKNTK